MRWLVAAAGAMLSAACSSIVSGTTQEIAINTNPPGADCTLEREGQIIGKVDDTPGGTLVQKTKHDITITCTKDGYQETTYINNSGLDTAILGNAILGGVIGAAVDSATGADNKYESPVNITLLPMAAEAAR
jgi:hypothetical protein